jgi:4a-hydroxytetrahydrobiopterin dehydratase
MTVWSAEQLRQRECLACEGGLPRLPPEEAASQLAQLPGWTLTHGGERIRKEWRVKDFAAGMEFLSRVTEVAEAEWHHPDLHLEGFRNVWIEIWTHAAGGLTENDFVLAAKIDALPVMLKES